MKTRLLTTGLIFCSFLAAPVAAHEAPAGVEAQYPFAYATSPQQKNGAVYVTLRNMARTPDTLTGASSPLAERAELHTIIMKEDADTGAAVTSMKRADSFYFPEMSTLYFDPAGRHIMLLGLKKQLVPGETVPLTLTFKQAGDVKLEALIVDNSTVMQGEAGMSRESHDHHHPHDHGAEGHSH